MLQFVQGKQDQSINSLQQAIEFNPNFAVAYGYLSLASAHAGDSTLAISMGNKALKLSPHDPEIIHFLIGIGTAHFVAGDYQEAVNFADRARQARPNAPATHRLMATGLARLGKLEEANQAVVKMLDLRPNMTVTAVRNTIKFKNSEHAEKYLEGLRLAGLPE